MSQAPYETTAAGIETETSTVELANNEVAAAEAAPIAGTSPYPANAAPASAVTPAANVESRARDPVEAHDIHNLADHHTAGVAQHAASTAHTKEPGLTGEPKDALTQLKHLGSNAIATAQAYIPGSANANASPAPTHDPIAGTATSIYEAAPASPTSQSQIDALTSTLRTGADSDTGLSAKVLQVLPVVGP
ncbi:hypothetical protein FA95DRAFT_1601878 [Auriscalpium vulgare]|uniref:Uncharacterized protein n=1 Tax=Auriscalpium vulgare TaxID=40419 RepID=A0ACB8S8M6_9AGAM|nr:hypothetical protein FA95DRAFT_1601878 [Auriscalpium vulgare]